MTIHLDHVLVPSRDKLRAARLLADLLGVPWSDKGIGPFAPVYTRAGVAAFARDVDSSKQVWSAVEGYPGDPAYRDFYRDVGFDRPLEEILPFIHPDGIRVHTGLKYHRVTGKVDLAITNTIPSGYAGEKIFEVKFIPVAHPDHELHQLGRPVEMRDLRKHRHVVVRDSGTKRDKKVRTLESPQRWTVSNMSTSIGAVSRGYGFAWLPQYKIIPELLRGELKELQMSEPREYMGQLYLVYADREGAGPGLLRLAQIMREEITTSCAKRDKMVANLGGEGTR